MYVSNTYNNYYAVNKVSCVMYTTHSCFADGRSQGQLVLSD